MEITHTKIMVGITLLFFVGLILFLDEVNKPSVPPNEIIAANLFMRALEVGENATSYIYSFVEYSDGFPETYTLASDGKISSVTVTNVLSTKKIFFLENDTIACVKMDMQEACSSIKNESITERFASSLKGRLFDNSVIEAAKQDNKYRIEKGLQVFGPEITPRILDHGDECLQISYHIDYSNATMDELGRFGIVPGSPSRFDVTECILNNTGEVLESRFNYSFQGVPHDSRFNLVSSDFSSGTNILVPKNLSEGAVELLLLDSGKKKEIMNCYLLSGSDQDKCIATLALQTKNIDMCGLAGARTDRCYVSLVPMIKDETICKRISSQDFLDDCFIELAGAYKNSTYCENVSESAKKAMCLDVSVSSANSTDPVTIPPKAELPKDNSTSNDSGILPPEVQKIFDELSKSVSGTANTTDLKNDTGTPYAANGTR